MRAISRVSARWSTPAVRRSSPASWTPVRLTASRRLPLVARGPGRPRRKRWWPWPSGMASCGAGPVASGRDVGSPRREHDRSSARRHRGQGRWRGHRDRPMCPRGGRWITTAGSVPAGCDEARDADELLRGGSPARHRSFVKLLLDHEPESRRGPPPRWAVVEAVHARGAKVTAIPRGYPARGVRRGGHRAIEHGFSSTPASPGCRGARHRAGRRADGDEVVAHVADQRVQVRRAAQDPDPGPAELAGRVRLRTRQGSPCGRHRLRRQFARANQLPGKSNPWPRPGSSRGRHWPR